MERIRQSWPHARIVLRSDSVFCRDRPLSKCDRNDVWYVVGFAKNEYQKKLRCSTAARGKKRFERTGNKQQLFQGFPYQNASLKWLRHAIDKTENGPKGENPRLVIIYIDDDPEEPSDRTYCPRGEFENRIKEQLQLFHDRTSAHGWWAIQWRLLLSALVYTLMEALRRLGLNWPTLNVPPSA